MKQIIFFLISTLAYCHISTWAYSQTPQGIPYQAVARDASGNLISSQNVSLRFTIHEGNATGIIVFAESQNVTTNSLGLFSVNIGQGTTLVGPFSAINWGIGTKFLQVELDALGSGFYTNMGTSQMMSVPYALQAATSGDNKWTQTGGSISNANTGNVGIGTTTPAGKLHISYASTPNCILESSSIGGTWLNVGNTSSNGKWFGIISTGSNSGMGPGKLLFSANNATQNIVSNIMVLDHTTGNVGIGNTSPGNKLSVGGGNADFSGSVGIGTTTPTNNLSVVGNTNMTGFLGVGTGPTNAKLSVLGNASAPSISTTNPLLLRLANYQNQTIDFGKMSSGDLAGWIQVGYNYLYPDPLSLQPVGGHVGIGTTFPQAPLHVVGAGITTPVLARVFFNAGSSLVANTSSSGNILIRADGYFWANGGGFVATSDNRIKHILGNTNTANDLSILSKIQITDYKYIDEVSNGSKLQKKVIAQQLQEVYPDAVNINEGVIPNVFETAHQVITTDNSTIITTNKKHDFKTGDMVRLILEKGSEKNLAVTVIDEHTFSVAEIINDNVFVYGKKVNDLLNVDYDAVAMLNVSATQELAKRVEELTKENAELKNELHQQLMVIEAKLADLKNGKEMVSIQK